MNTSKELCKWLHKPTYIKTSSIVIREIKKYYKKRDITDIGIFPHYTFWNKRHYGIKVPIFRKLTDSWEDEQYIKFVDNKKEYYLSRLPTEQNNLSEKERRKRFLASLGENKKIRKTYQKGQALSKYIEVFEKLEMGSCFENYCDFITTIIRNEWKYLLYDIIVDQKCEQRRATLGELNLEYSYDNVRDINTKTICDWFKNSGLNFYDRGSTSSDQKAFEKFAKTRIDEISFPYKFKMNAAQKLVTIENAYKEIQLELIYSQDLRKLFKPRKYNGNRSDGLSMYKFKEICDRIKPIFTKEISSNHDQLEEYTYIIEKITGVNLAICFSKYYSVIRKNSRDIIPESEQEFLLYGILDELIDMPNVFSRIQILKEYMEPVLFWTGDLTKKLREVGKSLRDLKNIFSKEWIAIKDTLEKEQIPTHTILECCSFDFRESIKHKTHPSYPFIFVNTKHLQKHNDFDMICKHIIEKIYNFSTN